MEYYVCLPWTPVPFARPLSWRRWSQTPPAAATPAPRPAPAPGPRRRQQQQQPAAAAAAAPPPPPARRLCSTSLSFLGKIQLFSRGMRLVLESVVSIDKATGIVTTLFNKNGKEPFVGWETRTLVKCSHLQLFSRCTRRDSL